ncbi:MAG: GNAT family N-acetyltransferase [Candidatus Heimdallarchaeota archaeon]|nr:GNAT family N-acetyltransferase [Candidatus Heimdallarchaeota archaeon]
MSVENSQYVSLKPITVENWKKAVKLEVNENQKSYIASNIHSIAESSFYETSYNYGIYQNEELVGFVLFFNPPEEPELGHIVRFMIDKNHQRKGLGREGIKQVIELLSTKFSKKIITLTVIPDNHTARAFYENVGFINTYEIVDKELKYKYTVK